MIIPRQQGTASLSSFFVRHFSHHHHGYAINTTGTRGAVPLVAGPLEIGAEPGFGKIHANNPPRSRRPITAAADHTSRGRRALIRYGGDYPAKGGRAMTVGRNP